MPRPVELLVACAYPCPARAPLPRKGEQAALRRRQQGEPQSPAHYLIQQPLCLAHSPLPDVPWPARQAWVHCKRRRPLLSNRTMLLPSQRRPPERR